MAGYSPSGIPDVHNVDGGLESRIAGIKELALPAEQGAGTDAGDLRGYLKMLKIMINREKDKDRQLELIRQATKAAQAIADYHGKAKTRETASDAPSGRSRRLSKTVPSGHAEAW